MINHNNIEEIKSIQSSKNFEDNINLNKEQFEKIIVDSVSILENSLSENSKKTSEKSLNFLSSLNHNNKMQKENNFYFSPISNMVNTQDGHKSSFNQNFYNDNDKVGNDLKKITDELILQLQDQAIISKENFQLTEMNINRLKNDFSIKLDYMENRQRLQLETLRYSLEHSRDRKIKDPPVKVMDPSRNKIINLL